MWSFSHTWLPAKKLHGNKSPRGVNATRASSFLPQTHTNINLNSCAHFPKYAMSGPYWQVSISWHYSELLLIIHEIYLQFQRPVIVRELKSKCHFLWTWSNQTFHHCAASTTYSNPIQFWFSTQFIPSHCQYYLLMLEWLLFWKVLTLFSTYTSYFCHQQKLVLKFYHTLPYSLV